MTVTAKEDTPYKINVLITIHLIINMFLLIFTQKNKYQPNSLLILVNIKIQKIVDIKLQRTSLAVLTVHILTEN
ncbi:hypothetical protein COO59_16320 [Mixta theicola]|uniref:Uncharacterized protein n=1 Tax=Mixta theicola TaxID=1458355 RepID=A0A2K1Q6Q0_9GAMM|nr:hypothetical protein COO59_16320 [Mixta theicola]